MQGIERRDEIFAGAPAHQFAIELDVIDAADDDNLGRRIADFSKAIELVERGLAVQPGLDDQKIRRHLAVEVIHGALDAAEMNVDVCLRQAPVGTRALQGSSGIRELHEGRDGNARHGSFVRRGAECLAIFFRRA